MTCSDHRPGEFVCARGMLAGLKRWMPSPRDLPMPRSRTRDGDVCGSSGSRLQAAAAGGSCSACAAVQPAPLAPCGRLVGRELAQETRGIAAAVGSAVGAREFELVMNVRHGEALQHALAVSRHDVARLGAFFAELGHTAGVPQWR